MYSMAIEGVTGIEAASRFYSEQELLKNDAALKYGQEILYILRKTKFQH
jgi:hypothetical protein